MSRELRADFQKLHDFFSKYNLLPVLANGDFITILSQQHKKYYSYLTCIAELLHQKENGNIGYTISKDKQFAFIVESCSDIGNAIFLMANGSYKAAKLMQRSSIETFIKGFNLDEIPNIDSEKSVYKIFDNVKAANFFGTSPSKEILSEIHHMYKRLCADTHTASAVNMQHITALKYFPAFSKKLSISVSDNCMQLVSAYITLLVLKFTKEFKQMDYRNKEVILLSIPKQYKKLVQGIKL